MPMSQTELREVVERHLDRARSHLGHVAVDAMEGDNLAVTLCSRFDDADGVQDDNGWTDAATSGCEATLAAIHHVYEDAIEVALRDHLLQAEREGE